jgi:dihydroorotase
MTRPPAPRTVIRRAHLVDARGDHGLHDLYLQGGVVEGVDVGGDAAVELDAAGALVTPAFIDLHAHLREPGQEVKEDLESGLAAAAAGGFPDVFVMPNTRPVNDTRAITEMLVYKARAIGGSRLHPIAAITVGQKGETLTEMADLKDAGAVAVSDDGHCVTRSDVMRRALEYASTFDLPLIQHAEDHALTAGAQMHEGAVSTKLGLRGWPRVAEDIIVARDVLLAEYTRAKYHVAHVSTLGSVRILREAKSRGIAVTAEVTPHHLLLTDASLLGYDAVCKVNPPLREDEDVAALREALADGTIDCIATDHAPHSTLEKDCVLDEAAPGMIGLELCVPLMLGLVEKGAFSLARMAAALTRAPAGIVGLPCPRLCEGAEASFTLIDPERSWTVAPERLRSKSANTPFLGQTVKGMVILTVVRGAIAHES